MRAIREVYGWVQLQLRRHIAGEPHGEVVGAPALIIQLKTPGLVEIMSPTEKQLRLIVNPDRTGHPLVLGCVIARLEERLRI
jgi:hypothetical protein